MKKKVVITCLVIILFGVWTWWRLDVWYMTNKICHEACKNLGHKAGEEKPLHTHTICTCFSAGDQPPVDFVLEVDDKLED
jgi:hypothetical protein